MNSEVSEVRNELRQQLDEQVGGLRTEIGARFDRVEGRIDQLDGKLARGVERLDGRIDALQVTLTRVGGGVIIGLVGVIAAVLARGV